MNHPESFWQLTSDIPPQPDPLQQAARERCGRDRYVRGWVIVGREPGRNDYTAEIEHSFSMDQSNDRARLYRRRQDGYEDLGEEESLRASQKTRNWPMPMRVFDIDDPECPIVLDWIYYETHRGDDISRYKFEVRNLRFMVKEDHTTER